MVPVAYLFNITWMPSNCPTQSESTHVWASLSRALGGRFAGVSVAWLHNAVIKLATVVAQQKPPSASKIQIKELVVIKT